MKYGTLNAGDRPGYGFVKWEERGRGKKEDPSSYNDFPGTTASFSACNPFTSNKGSRLLSGCLYDPPALSAHVKYWP